MIISNKLKCIFVAIPKTATHAIRFALRKFLDDQQDWEQVELFVQKKLPFSELSKIDTGHIKAAEAKSVLAEELWERYFKFAVVRNPYDRFVSFCAFIQRENPHFEKNARILMKEAIADPEIRQRIRFRPQYEFVCDCNGKIIVDFLARHERIQEDYQQICGHLGIRAQTLPRVNRSIHSRYTDYYDQALRDAVFEYYHRDFELFDYNPLIR
jgi:hypothetical protein